MLSCLLKSAHPSALAAMKEIYNAEGIDNAQVSIKAFEIDYGAKHPMVIVRIEDRRRHGCDVGVLQVSG